MTGSVMGNTLRDLWAQVYLLDGGQRLFHSERAFLNWWFLPGKCTAGGIKQWFPKKGSKQEIAERLADIAYEIDVSSVKLPTLREETIDIVLPDKVKKMYRQLENSAFVNIDRETVITVFSVQAAFQKCRQLANGFIYEDAGEERLTHSIHTEKIKEIQRQVQLAQGEGVMVVCNFREEVDRLRRLYPNMGWINGTTTSRQRKDFIDRWNRKDMKMLAIHPQSGGEGINLQHGGRLQIWSSLGWSAIRHNQTVGRLWRTGQKSDTVKVKYLIAKDTIDEVMYTAMKANVRDGKSFLALLRAYQKQVNRA